MDTVLERVTGWMKIQRDKHELGIDYVEDTVNEMSNYELLGAISDAVSDIVSELHT